jgi:uncharacterized membrane protein
MFVVIGLILLVVLVAAGFWMGKGSRHARRAGADVQPAGRVDVVERPGSPS